MAHPEGRVNRAVLSNGLTVLALMGPGRGTFTAALALDAGSRHDPARKSGLAALTGSMLLEGNERAGPAAFAARLDSMGASLEVVTGYEMTTLILTALAESRSAALDALCDAVRAPLFDPERLAWASDRQLTEVREDDEDPYAVCRREFFAAVFGSHPRGRPILGRPGTVAGLTREDVVGYHAGHIAPSRSILALVGDADPTEFVEAAARSFEEWSAASPPPEGAPEPIPGPRSVRRWVEMARAQTHLAVGGPGIARTDGQYYAAGVMDVIFGDSAGFGSRLAARLREEEGLAYVVESDTCCTAGEEPGAFWVYTATSPGSVEAALASVLDEMERLRASPPSPEEMSRAVSYLLGRHRMALETNDSRAVRLVRIERFGLGLDYDLRYPSLIRSVRAADVLEVARRIVNPDACAVVTVGPGSASPSA